MNKETFIRDGNNLLKVTCSEILNELLHRCVDNYFPELQGYDIKIGYVINHSDLGGAKAGKWVILFLSDAMTVGHSGLKWIVVHELCHFINLHNPDEIFKKRVPKDVWEMWKRLEKGKELKCDKGEK